VSIRYVADEDLNDGIIRGLRAREPAIDILDVKTSALRGMKDPALLEMAYQHGRILITNDRRTMTRHFQVRLVAGNSTPGVFIVPQRPSAIGEIIEWLILVWTASHPDEWRDRIVFPRFR
jgi:hypothetical protein